MPKPTLPPSRIATLNRGITHPQIDLDYYAWLRSHGDFEKGFRKKYSRSYRQFHAIAQWVWGASRQQLRAQADAADVKRTRARRRLRRIAP